MKAALDVELDIRNKLYTHDSYIALRHEDPKPKKSTHMGRKGRRAKTKTVLKPVNQVAKLGSMQNLIS